MEFEWDEKKNQINITKHKISFEEAVEIFNKPVLTISDNRKDYGETRKISVGSIQEIVIIVVVHTNRNQKNRIISARTANQKERKKYYAHLKTKTS